MGAIRPARGSARAAALSKGSRRGDFLLVLLLEGIRDGAALLKASCPAQLLVHLLPVGFLQCFDGCREGQRETWHQAVPAQHVWGNQARGLTELLQTQRPPSAVPPPSLLPSGLPPPSPLPKTTQNTRSYPLLWLQPPLRGAAPSPAAAAPAPAGGASGAPPSPAGGTTPSRPGCARRPPAVPGKRTRSRRSEGLEGARHTDRRKGCTRTGALLG